MNTAHPPALPSGPAPSPTLNALFWGFSWVGLSGFGGVLPFARRMLVDERRWMTAEDFNTQLGMCQFLPGPNVVNDDGMYEKPAAEPAESERSVRPRHTSPRETRFVWHS